MFSTPARVQNKYLKLFRHLIRIATLSDYQQLSHWKCGNGPENSQWQTIINSNKFTSIFIISTVQGVCGMLYTYMCSITGTKIKLTFSYYHVHVRYIVITHTSNHTYMHTRMHARIYTHTHKGFSRLTLFCSLELGYNNELALESAAVLNSQLKSHVTYI